MNKPLSPKDYETLSAYLDGQLSPRDRAKVEARIQTHPEWRTEFEDLRSTRLLLRSMPKRRAPRNFTLTPAMVGRSRPAPRAYPFFRLASAVASALLIIVFASDLAINLTAQSLARTAASAPAQVPAAAQRTLTKDAPTIEALQGQPAPLLAAPQPAPLPTNAAAADTAATAEPQATAAPEAARNAVEPATSAPAAEPTAAPESVGCAGTCQPEPTATPEEAFSMQAAPSQIEQALPTPVVDETEHAIAAMTAAPLGMGGGPGEAETPEPFLKMAPETASPEPALPMAAAPVQPTAAVESQPAASAPTAEAPAPPAAAQGQTFSLPEETPALTAGETNQPTAEAQPFNAVPGLRLAEAILAGIAVIAGIAAVLLRFRSGS